MFGFVRLSNSLWRRLHHFSFLLAVSLSSFCFASIHQQLVLSVIWVLDVLRDGNKNLKKGSFKNFLFSKLPRMHWNSQPWDQHSCMLYRLSQVPVKTGSWYIIPHFSLENLYQFSGVTLFLYYCSPHRIRHQVMLIFYDCW